MRIISTHHGYNIYIITFLSIVKVTNSSIPRSTRHHNYHESYNTISSYNNNNPPWNPSSKIDNEGFLKEYYRCIPGEWEDETISTTTEVDDDDLILVNTRKKYKIPTIVQIRQVPGDGNCLFHSIATCLSLAENKTHVNIASSKSSNNNNNYGNYLSTLSYHSKRLRQEAVNCLSNRPRRPLFIQGNEYLRAYDLVEAAASQYNLTGTKYCELMRKESYWGGGPEIVALCNVLRRPIYVYELVAANNNANTNIRGGSAIITTSQATHQQDNICINSGFCLRRMACFGSPKFNRREAIHILSADSRFPDIAPGKQLQNGNHFLALFPAKVYHHNSNLDLKGGGNGAAISSDSTSTFRKKKHTLKLRNKKLSSTIPNASSNQRINNNNNIATDVNTNALVSWFTRIRKLLIQMSFTGSTKQ